MSDMNADQIRERAEEVAEIVAELDAYGKAVRGRDDLIRRAAAKRINKQEIARRMDLSPDTIWRVLTGKTRAKSKEAQR